jgi:hypothetical protein
MKGKEEQVENKNAHNTGIIGMVIVKDITWCEDENYVHITNTRSSNINKL